MVLQKLLKQSLGLATIFLGFALAVNGKAFSQSLTQEPALEQEQTSVEEENHAQTSVSESSREESKTASEDEAGEAIEANSESASSGSDELQVKPKQVSKSYEQCSLAFHKDLNFIHHSLALPLRKSINEGRKRNKSLPRKLIFRMPKQTRSPELNAAIKYARNAAAQRASEPWLRTESGGWLSFSMAKAIGNYTGQSPSPHLCTGMEGFINYLEPHQKKITRIIEKRADHLAVAISVVADQADKAWHAAKPVPLPNFAPKRPTQFQNILATTVNKGIVKDSSSKQEEESQPQELPADHPDLPLLKPEDAIFKFTGSEDIVEMVQTLYQHYSDTSTLPDNTPDPIEGTGGDPHEIFNNVNQWITGDYKISNLLARNQLNAAMSAIEVAYNIEFGAQALVRIETKLGLTFAAIKDAHLEKCTCE